ncbi:Nitroreductase family protein [Euzebya pacifica]|uniref:Putative NAD(P)H nitroreductase n=1 Tax=Euzebya pacifica TaxID=1608957 RepID=A0A346XT83_9ACTN|nr:nitroreductase [Euzebya pacifica]AXV05430.1 Nitroreductase family protein [Euzebya pacifica]
MDALTAIATRRSVPRLVAPGPDEVTLERLLQAAVAAPDHGQLQPWRFVVIEGDARERLGEVFARAHAAREPDADPGALDKTACKPLRAPTIVAAVSTPFTPEEAWNGKAVPTWEQEAAVAAAVQNLCLAAHAMGLGAMWRTGWFGDAPEVREALALREPDRIIGWVYLGTIPASHRPAPRRPAEMDAVVQRWT